MFDLITGYSPRQMEIMAVSEKMLLLKEIKVFINSNTVPFKDVVHASKLLKYLDELNTKLLDSLEENKK